MAASEAGLKEVQAPCSACVRETRHRVLHEAATRDEDRVDRFALLQCAGCGSVSMGRQTVFTPDGEVEQSYYPSPIARQVPKWVLGLVLGFGLGPEAPVLGGLLMEVYAAIAGEQYRLAAMGIRAIVEHTIIAKVGDKGTFEKNLDAFEEGGFISFIQRDAIKRTLDLGHAATHRGFMPTDRELNTALDIIEGVLAAIYDHTPSAAEMTKRVPARKPKGQSP